MTVGDIAMFGSALIMFFIGLTRVDWRASAAAAVVFSCVLLYFARYDLAIGSALGGRSAFNISVVLFLFAFIAGLLVIYFIGRLIRNALSS